jgi:hypothetical protein
VGEPNSSLCPEFKYVVSSFLSDKAFNWRAVNIEENLYLLAESTGRFTMFSVITNIYNKKTKGPTLVELFTATGKMKRFFDN